MTTRGYLGIDAGTQGLSVLFCDEDLNVIASGDAGYEMVAGLDEGCYEQHPDEWTRALADAMLKLRSALPANHRLIEVLAIGISGQMHGEVLVNGDGKALGPARLWCDSRNESEGAELTERFDVKIPKRMTVARWLWTIRNQPEKAAQVSRLTTPAGWLAYQLTGQWNLGIGDAAGMFPIDQDTLDYDRTLLQSFDELVADGQLKTLGELLPTVRRAGDEAGSLNESGANLLELNEGVPVAPAEGDQPASLAGALIGAAGMVSVSFGTSVCANSVGDRVFEGVSNAVDHFCAPDGKPINMVWLRNGTTYMNSVVEMFGAAIGGSRSDGFEAIMPKVIAAEPDCGGVLALPFMDDEPGLGVRRGGTAMLVGLNSQNATPGNAVKAALLSTMFNLRLGCEELDRRGFPRTELILSGGLTRTPETGQILADVFNTPVSLLDSAEEGCAWGAALMAKFRQLKSGENAGEWSSFLADHAATDPIRFEPSTAAAKYHEVYQRYKSLMKTQPQLDAALGDQ